MSLASRPRLCLVSMPFVPINMPGTGISTLKAALTARGLDCDIYYGALDFLKFFAGRQTSRNLRLDYDFIATNMFVGELFFAGTLWDDPRSAEWMEVAIHRFATTPNQIFSVRQMERMAERLRDYSASSGAFMEHCFGARDWTQYDIIGFSSTFSQNVASLALAKRIRASQPQACIVFGGANCEDEMGVQLLRSFPFVDYVIRGEADFAFPDFVTRWRHGDSVKEIPGIVLRQESGVVAGAPAHPVSDMNALPIPDYTDFFDQLPAGDTADSLDRNVVLPIETSRGCWWGAVRHCVFCGLNPTTMRFRSKTGERALAEFRHLRQRYGRMKFYAVDNILDKKYIRDLLPHLRDDKLDIFYETKSNLRETEVILLRQAGVTHIQPGIEGLNSIVLALMKKGVKGYQNIELLKWCATHRVEVTWFYLFGFPAEPEEAYLADIASMHLLHHLPPPRNANPVLLDRFSPLYTQRDAFGIRNVRVPPATRLYYSGLAEEEIGNLTYHFEMDLPQADACGYADRLRQAVLSWKLGYYGGARFYQFTSGANTVLIDTRGEETRSYLLEGSGARLYALLRTSKSLHSVRDAWAADPGEDVTLSADAMHLAQVALWLGAITIVSPATDSACESFLADLVARGLILAIDDLFLALAIDCVDIAEAVPLGLERYVPDAVPEASATAFVPTQLPADAAA